MADYSRDDVLAKGRAGQKLARTDPRGIDLSNLVRANLSKSLFSSADFTGADLRGADLSGGDIRGAKLTGAKTFGATSTDANLEDADVEYIDTSSDGDGSRRITGEAAIEVLRSGRTAPEVPGRRYFGVGDVMRNATLEFGDRSQVEIESRFEKCSLVLGNDSSLVVSEAGALRDCTVVGAGNITIHGTFFEGQSPSIVGAKQLTVSSRGAVIATVHQPVCHTHFAFEPGARLRLTIVRPDNEKGR